MAAGGVAVGTVIAAAAALAWGIQTTKDLGFDVSDELEDLSRWLDELPLEDRIAVFEALPTLAGSVGKAVISLGDGVRHLGEIVEQNEWSGARSIEILHPVYGRMTIRQQLDVSAERYRNLDASFWDPEQRKHVTEKLPSSRFTLPPETGRRGTPPLEPPADRDFGPGGFGEQGVPDLPLTTGGLPPDHGPMSEPDGGFAPAEDQSPTVTVSPDQSEELGGPIITYNEEGTPIYDGIPISERFIHKAGQKHDIYDVWYDEKGYPIFDDYAIATVEIELTGSRSRDKRIAKKMALESGILPSIPEGYTWHHHQDMKTLQLIPDYIHRGVGHTGGQLNYLKRSGGRT